MHTQAAIFNILKTSGSASNPALQEAGGDEGMSAQLNMTDPARLSNAGTKGSIDYLSPVYDLIASAFVRYKVKKLVFHYEPQASATDSQRLVFAYANDPLHPILWNATIPTQASCLALADSIAFMPWRAWSMDVTHRLGDNTFFTFSDSSTTVTEFVERFSDFGVISCITSENSVGAPVVGGVLYMEAVIEFSEFCPISVTRPSSLQKMARKALKHGARSISSDRPQPDHEKGTTAREPTELERLQSLIEQFKKN